MSRPLAPDFRRVLLALAASMACLVGPTPVSAADGAAAAPKAPAKPGEGSLGKGSSSGPLLTKEQLRQCIAEQGRLKQEGASLAQTQSDLDKARADIDRLGSQTAADLATLDRTSEPAVTAYNDKVRERAKLTEAYKTAASPFNQRVDKLEADKQAFAKDCADRRYREDDFNDLKAGK